MDFYKRWSLVGEHIPYGKVVTYGQLAKAKDCMGIGRNIIVTLKRTTKPIRD